MMSRWKKTASRCWPSASIFFASPALSCQRDKDLLAVVGVDVRRHQTIDWPSKRAVQAVDEQSFKDRALETTYRFPVNE